MPVGEELLAPTDVEEAYSQAFASAVAAGAGYSVATSNFDRDGVDLCIQAGGAVRPKIDVQLKATINLALRRGALKYPLKKRNYELLRLPTQTPRILVVLHLPRDQQEWLNITPQELAIRGGAYWVSLLNQPDRATEDSVTIDIPGENRFDVAALRRLMDLSRTGRIA